MKLDEAKHILNKNGYLIESGRDTRFKRNVVDFGKLNKEQKTDNGMKSKIDRALKKFYWSKYYDFKVKTTKTKVIIFAEANEDYVEKIGYENFADGPDFQFEWDIPNKDCYYRDGNATFGNWDEGDCETIDDFLTFIDDVLEHNAY